MSELGSNTSLTLNEAVERAIDECIKAGILSDFLRENRAEVMAMSIYEYDEELHMKSEREIWYNTGLEQGEIHLARVNQLHAILIDLGRLGDLKRATRDRSYQEQLMAELLPSLESGERI